MHTGQPRVKGFKRIAEEPWEDVEDQASGLNREEEEKVTRKLRAIANGYRMTSWDWKVLIKTLVTPAY